ncbi:MAG: Asp23/Gls24 family envelope stress response protein [Clostridiales bacterium]|nr:Asp23/Gls24 family envelope stress response protein [Clostridiales bacterium]
MIIKNDKGMITIAPEAISSIAGCAAMSCFGVKGMTVRSVADGIVKLLKKSAMSRGVKITENEDGELEIELHIAVEHGVNITAACHAIINQVRYHVERMTGVKVKNVEIFVDSINVG